MTKIREKTIAGLKIGDVLEVTRTFTEKEVIAFARLSRDYNPVHFDKRFTEVKKMKGLICHGLLVAGMVTEIGGQIGWLASGMNFEFKYPVYIGDTVTCTMTIVEIDARNRARAEAVFRNQAGIVVLRSELSGIVPGPEEIRVLKDMVSEGDPTNKYG
jgi:acyl dehydratase